MTPKRKKVFISSLGLFTASWVFPVEGNAAVAEPVHPPEDPDAIREQIAEEALYRYYNPFASLEQVKPLKQSEKPMKYKVKSGDTLSEIAKQYDLSTEQLAAFNRISNIDSIRAGKTLKIPYRSKEIRIVEAQDLKSLAKKYKVSKAFIKKLNPELEEMDGEMYIGQVVTVPKRMDVTKSLPKTPETDGGTDLKNEKKGIRLASHSSTRGADKASASAFSGTFAWPVGGQITSPYGQRDGRLHRGIDIWNAKESRTPIKAAASGVVSRAGYSGNYGNLIVIDHGGGWTTYYAHLRTIQVSKGESVGGGQQIGYMGSSGNSTGYHLHFEVRQNDQNLDPLSVLP